MVASEPYQPGAPDQTPQTAIAENQPGSRASWYASIKARISKLFTR
jgi:hypothetical protein